MINPSSTSRTQRNDWNDLVSLKEGIYGCTYIYTKAKKRGKKTRGWQFFWVKLLKKLCIFMFVFFLYIEIFFIYYEFYFIFLKTIITWSRWSNHLLGAQLFGVAQTRRSQRNNRAPQGVQPLRPLHFHFSGSMNRKAGGCRRVPPASSILDRLNLVKSSRTTSLYI